nr:hypothetical protein [uncultured Flavobacterium sp.]
MMSNQPLKLLDSAILLTKKLHDKVIDSGYNKGIIDLCQESINAILSLEEKQLIEIFTDTSVSIEIDQLANYIRQKVTLEIKTGNIHNYFETLENFISGNKFECRLQDFFIADIDYRENISENNLILNYKKNLQLINFLKEIAENKKVSSNEIELFFYKSGKGVDIIINYELKQLDEFSASITSEFKRQLLEPFNGEDKKQLFINELINFLEKNGKSYEKLIQGWDNLISSYNKSYSLFLSGFSFEKIKTSSTEHFQKLVEKIYESIGKVASYIFGIPIGYILLLNNFDFTGALLIKNFILLILGFIFLILIWFVLFKNIDESIKAIEDDIIDFITKIENVSELESIKVKLENLRNKEIKKQQSKLSLVKILTIVIYVMIVLIFCWVFIDKSIFI